MIHTQLFDCTDASDIRHIQKDEDALKGRIRIAKYESFACASVWKVGTMCSENIRTSIEYRSFVNWKSKRLTWPESCNLTPLASSAILDRLILESAPCTKDAWRGTSSNGRQHFDSHQSGLLWFVKRTDSRWSRADELLGAGAVHHLNKSYSVTVQSVLPSFIGDSYVDLKREAGCLSSAAPQQLSDLG